MPAAHRDAVFSDEQWTRLHALGPVVEAGDGEDLGALLSRVGDVEVVVTGTGTGRLPTELLDAMPGLRAIVHTAGTLRPIVDESIYGRGVQLSSQAPANALPVAEYTLAMVLLELKGTRLAEQAYRRARGPVDVDDMLRDHGVYERVVGVIAASSIGRRVIELLQSFDVDVLVADPYLQPDDAARLGASLVPLDELLERCDVVTLHAPLLPETVGMIGAAELARLRDGAVFINTARGALVDEQSLVAELLTGRFRAVLDVLEPEVPDAGSPLWTLENVVLTPHVAGSRGRELRRIGERAVDELWRLAEGRPLRFAVSPERYATNA
jgi:phosphoglycerate dehydrogenase-like enzyme